MSASSGSAEGHSATGSTASLKGAGPTDSDLDYAISLLRARIDEEFRIRERLDSKQRQAFALVAGFFAVVQTVALRFLDAGDTLARERTAIAATAVLAGAFVVWVGVRLVHGEELESQDDLKPDAIKRWIEEAASAPTQQHVPRRIVSRLVTIAEDRTAKNETLAGQIDGVQTAAVLALLAAGLELIVAVGTQLT